MVRLGDLKARHRTLGLLFSVNNKYFTSSTPSSLMRWCSGAMLFAQYLPASARGADLDLYLYLEEASICHHMDCKVKVEAM